MEFAFDVPMVTNGIRCTRGGQFNIGEIKGGFVAQLPEAGFGILLLGLALDADDGSDMRLPIGIRELVWRIKDRHDSCLVPLARYIISRNGANGFGYRAMNLNRLTQRRLIVFQLNDQVGLRFGRSFECFFDSAEHRL